MSIKINSTQESNSISSFSEGKFQASKSFSQDPKDNTEKPRELLVLTKKLPEVLYIFLGSLIIALLGLNFWFGFHLILLIPLFTVIAFLILLLTEFSEFHNLTI